MSLHSCTQIDTKHSRKKNCHVYTICEILKSIFIRLRQIHEKNMSEGKIGKANEIIYVYTTVHSHVSYDVVRCSMSMRSQN